MLSFVSTGRIVVYGATLEAYAFIQRLIQLGVSGDKIVSVQPPHNAPTCFNNAFIEEQVVNSLKNAGLVYSAYICQK